MQKLHQLPPATTIQGRNSSSQVWWHGAQMS